MNESNDVSILLVDDHEIVRLGMRALLESKPHFHVVAETDGEEAAVSLAKEYQPNIVLMDVRLRQGNGIDACKRIVDCLPDTRVMMVSSFAEEELLFSAIRAGAVGYVVKQIGGGQLVQAVEAAARGQGVLDPSLTKPILDEVRRSMDEREEHAFSTLRNQEMQVLNLISQGATNHHIAEQLAISEGTARNYVSNILAKLNVANRAEAAAYAIQHHLQDHLNPALT